MDLGGEAWEIFISTLLLWWLYLYVFHLYLQLWQADIKSTIESYFDLQYEILSKLDIEELSTQVANNDGMFVSDSYADKFRTVMQMAVAHKSAQIVDLTYDRYNISIEYREIYISGNQALVKAFLIEQIYFNADSSIMSEAGTMHNISLQKMEMVGILQMMSFH